MASEVCSSHMIWIFDLYSVKFHGHIPNITVFAITSFDVHLVFYLNIWVDLLFCLLFRLITACTGTWKASRAFYYNKGISREDRSNESTKVCLQCCGEMLDLQWSFRTPNTSQWDAWNHGWKWASSGLLNSLFLVCITPFLYLRVTIEGNTSS
jgi:hypothetical protein